MAGRRGLGPACTSELKHNIAEAVPAHIPEEEQFAEDEERTTHETQEGQEGQGQGQAAEHWMSKQGNLSAGRGRFG